MTRAVEKMALERELRQALLRNEFGPAFQPQGICAPFVSSGAEALCCDWNHPTLGLLSPGLFLI